MRYSLRSRPAHAKTNRDAAIETHATSMKRAWPSEQRENGAKRRD